MEKLTIELLYDHTFNFAMYNNDVALIQKCKITNHSDQKLQDLELTMTFWPDFATSWHKKIEELSPNTTMDLGLIDLRVKPEYLYTLTERIKGQICIQVISSEETLLDQSFEIAILAFDEWNGNHCIPEIIAAFMIPNSPVIHRLIKAAAQYMEKWTTNSALNAYQENNPNRVKQQMAAIYQALFDLGIDYVGAPASFEARGQKIRLPQEIETYRIGTCLDLALLYASALEAVRLNPIIVFIQGHAFVGCWLIDECFPEGAFADESLLSKRVADGISEICVVECTSFAGKQPVKFDEAIKIAQSHLMDTSQFLYFVDVKRARISQIRPLPLKDEYTTFDAYMEHKQSSGNNVSAADAPDQLHKIEFIESNTPLEKTRIGNWQRQLLDLSLRNSLINYRNTATAITILCPNVITFEDALSKGEEYQLFPVPAELEGTLRDLEVYKKRTGNEFLAAITQAEFAQNRLRTLLRPNELNKTIINIYRKAKLAVEENGANVLYVGVGLLKWYENNATEVARYAPLLLIPMEITKKSSSFGYVLKKREEDPIFNVTLIQYIHSVFGKDLSALETLPSDENGVDVRTLFAMVRKLVMDMPRWEIEESAVLSVFSFNKFVMWNDLKNRTEQLKKNKIVHGLMNGAEGGVFDVSLEYSDDLDTAVNLEQIFITTSADASQLAAIHAASKGASFVLHGPPGTGKSQTITNMISNLLGNGKTVLFVAEKMAALSVVQRRLEQLGLSPFCMELHSNKSNKRDILKKLEETLYLGRYQKNEDWKIVSRKLYDIKLELNQYVQSLHKVYQIGFSLYDAFNRLTELRNTNTMAFFTSEVAYMYSREQFEKVWDFLRRLKVVGEICGHPYRNPLYGIEQEAFSSLLQGKVATAIRESRTYLEKLCKEENEFKELFSIYHAMGDVSFQDMASLFRLYEVIKDAPKIELALVTTTDFQQLKERLTVAIEVRRVYVKHRDEIQQVYKDTIETAPIDEWFVKYNEAMEGFFLWRGFSLGKVRKALRVYVKLGVKIGKKNLLEELQKIQSYREAKSRYDQVSKEALVYFGAKWDDLEQHRPLEEDLIFMEQFNEARLGIQSVEIRTCIQQHIVEILGKKASTAFVDIWETTIQHCTQLLDLLSANKVYMQTISQLTNTIEVWNNHQHLLQNYCQYNNVKREAVALDLVPMLVAYENGDIENNDILSSFEKAFYNAWTDKAIANDPALSAFSSALAKDKIALFAELDQRYTSLARQEVFQNLVERLPKVGQDNHPNSEVGVLVRAIHSAGRGIALRKLFEKIPNLLNRLAPCMLMSPISVAQYLDTDFPPFDVVIFDEASQMPTYEAIGAIARGKELIVVGDPKQLPPTAFFSNKPLEQDEDLVLQDLESVLDDCLAMNMPQKHLTWHYRSKHESLIAFSNYNFYEGKLLTFPSCDDNHSHVRFEKVEGFYDRGGTRQNRVEALAVVEEIVRQVTNHPTKSIGVVTFNQAQQALIEDLLDERISKDLAFENKLSGQATEPLFIKNLENVQGDERDIILFSIGYGKDQNGYMSMNFGPINQNGGWRRLNVAISRARYELIVYASITGDDISLSRTNAAGVMYLKSFLDYARRGVTALSVDTNGMKGLSETTSEVERDVYRRLVDNGYTVHQNVGTSKYKLPLAILSKKTGEYILGIEMDGSVFKSIHYARDREILICNVMKGLGWNLYRIWSQEWFVSSDKVFQELLRKLEELEGQESLIKEHELIVVAKDKDPLIAKLSSEKAAEEETVIYELASIKEVPMPSDSFYHRESTGILRKQIQEIINKESPVSLATVCRKIVNAWGMKRAGVKIEEQIMFVCDDLGLQQTKWNGCIYLWDKNMEIEKFSTYRVPNGNGNRRDVEDIAPEEMINATKAVLESQISLLEVDLAKEVAKKFGYVRLAESTAGKFIAVFRYAVTKGILSVDENGRYMVK